MRYDDPQVLELMRLYMTIQSDHEGGNFLVDHKFELMYAMYVYIH